jgi:hypothetical protein
VREEGLFPAQDSQALSQDGGGEPMTMGKQLLPAAGSYRVLVCNYTANSGCNSY